jgi:hypothetical protein
VPVVNLEFRCRENAAGWNEISAQRTRVLQDGWPPVGGAPGYEEYLEALSDPSHEEHEHMKKWVGRPFDPRAFSPAAANERLRKRLRLGKRPRGFA